MTDTDLAHRPDADLVKQARLWEVAMYGRDDARGRPATDYSWQRQEFDIARIKSAPDDWRKWMNEEIAMWEKDGDRDRYASMLNRPIEEDVCLVNIRGKGYLWDGYHRTASSLLQGRTTVMAIVGIPIFEVTNEMARSIIIADRPPAVTQPTLDRREVDKLLYHARWQGRNAIEFAKLLAHAKKSEIEMTRSATEIAIIQAYADYRELTLHLMAALDIPAPGGPDEDRDLILALESISLGGGAPLLESSVVRDLESLRVFSSYVCEPGKWVDSPTAEPNAIEACRRLLTSMPAAVRRASEAFETMRAAAPPGPRF